MPVNKKLGVFKKHGNKDKKIKRSKNLLTKKPKITNSEVD